MNRYGQTITWGTESAPLLFTGHTRSYSLRDSVTGQEFDDMVGDHVARVLHSRKGELNFEADVTSDSTDFLDLSSGAAIVVSDLNESSTDGVVLVTRAKETWRLQQRKTASIQATFFPDMSKTGAAPADDGLSAFTPTQTFPEPIVFPGGTIVYGTQGLSHGSGIVHGLTIEQQLTITEDEPSPDGLIKGCAAHGYMRTIELEVLSTGAKPAVRAQLTIGGGGLTHAADYRIESSEEVYADKRGKMYKVTAVWIPAY